jgi:homoaconitase/3-isopropylmalate dehydratase large subunit
MQNNGNNGMDTLQSMASVKGVESVFNPSCLPSIDEEQELFVEQQKFGHQVLEQTALTSEGMVIVCNQSQTKNAQIACAKLQDR